MAYSALLAHVYSSGESYKSKGMSRILSGYLPKPSVGCLQVVVGAGPRWIFRARRRLHAIDVLRGGNLSGWLAGTHSAPKFRLGRGELGRTCYVTLTLSVGPLDIDIHQLDAAAEHESVLREAAVLLAADFSANIIEKLEVRGLFLQGVSGEWVKTPEFTVLPPAVYVGRPAAELAADLSQASTTLSSLSIKSDEPVWSDWAHRGLLATEPWSEFVWFMFSVEQATEAYYRRWMPSGDKQRVRSRAERHVMAAVPGATINWRHASITMRFATVAEDLSPATAATDTATFHRLRDVRDAMLHGSREDPPDGARRTEARVLALKYSRLVSVSGRRH